LIAVSRASNATDLLPTSASGFAYSSFGSNTLPVTPGWGALIETNAATNLFLNSTAPVTHTITLSATGNYTLWVNGSGSAAIAAGTATITGAGTATNGSPVTINCTATGTVTVTITGSLNACQLESGSIGTSFIVTAGASATRAAATVTLINAASTLIGTGVFSTVFSLGGTLATNPRLLDDASGSYSLKNNGTPAQTGLALVATTTITANLGSGTLAAANKVGMSVGAGGSTLVGNNGTINTSGTGAWAGTSPPRLLIAYMRYLSRLDLFPTKIADATLKGYTV